MPSLAQTQGTVAFRQYDPGEALPGRAITRQTIAKAMAALQEMVGAWQERDLP
ncbi:hypothetical protein [Streptomyces sp. CBMA152]|uniref:hypothetical protein n=1 Tax=Streptomyces sp. CBMA152 TaxID=1896312 RepID=UPI001CB6C00E|nr:hypothetical protein [Streptomyces sp. CBMA152]